jgi:hypothetical protein
MAMRAVVTYESMYGNTRQIAEAVAEGIRISGPETAAGAGGGAPGVENEVVVLPVATLNDSTLVGADLLVMGGPTHVHGLPRASTRKGAVDAAGRPDSQLHLEPAATGAGIREWLEEAHAVHVQAAAFDTRMHGWPVFTGRASKSIARGLRRQGARLVGPARSFLVEKDNTLTAGEIERARRWGAELARSTRPATRSLAG